MDDMDEGWFIREPFLLRFQQFMLCSGDFIIPALPSSATQSGM